MKARTPEAREHLCAFFVTDQDRNRRAADFLAAGLMAGDRCVLAATRAVGDAIEAELEQRSATGQLSRSRGTLERVDYAQDITTQMKRWEAELRARSGRRKRLRFVGDLSATRLWERAAFDEIVEYESAFQRLSHQYSALTLCLYDARALSGVQASRILRSHPDTIRPPIELVTD